MEMEMDKTVLEEENWQALNAKAVRRKQFSSATLFGAGLVCPKQTML